MLELSAFASLAQFGAGLGLALAFFLEPITVRSQKFRRHLDSQFTLIPVSTSVSNEEKRGEIWQKIINLDGDVKNAIKLSRIPIALIKLGCVTNLYVLFMCTVAPECEIDYFWMKLILAITITPIAVGSSWMLILAKIKICDPRR